MNWLAKINLQVVVQRLGPFRSAILLFSIIGLSMYCGYRIGNYFHGYQMQTITNQNQRLDGLYKQQSEAIKRVNTLEVELEVERIANQRALASMKELEQQQFHLKKELAFYQKIMAPEKEADGLAIDEVTILPTESANHYRFIVVLVQNKKRRRSAKGFVELKIAGSQKGKPTTILLKDISDISKESLKFSFQYFQRIAGEFTLPQDFTPENIEVSAVLPKGKWQKYSRLDQNIKWPLANTTISQKAAEPLVILD